MLRELETQLLIYKTTEEFLGHTCHLDVRALAAITDVDTCQIMDSHRTNHRRVPESTGKINQN